MKSVPLILLAVFTLAPRLAWADPTELGDVVISGQQADLLGSADSSSQGTVGAKDLAYRPLARPGEVLEAIPGMIVTQHAGSGKANQYYLRGFNLDHGTDFSFYVDGVPVNLPSHAHGQGYADLNWLIPELVKKVDYEKGPFYAEQGDFGNAGSAAISYYEKLPANFADLEGGTLGFGRALVASSPTLGQGHLLYALEANHFDGAWQVKQNYKKLNGLVKYAAGDERNGLSVSGMGYHGAWYGNEQVPERAILSGLLDPYGSLDRQTGGVSSRYGLSGDWHRQNESSATKITAYLNRYDLDLFSDFTYFKDDPVNGDQFEQKDGRIYAGVRASHSLYGKLFGLDTENTFGLQARQDWMQVHLYRSANRVVVSQTRYDQLAETNLAPYFENKTRWTPWYRTAIGAREDFFQVNSASSNAANSGSQTGTVFSPKATMTFGPWAATEYYLEGGFGFRTNDARGVLSPVKPDNSGPSRQLALIVPSRGAEIGLRSSAVKNLRATFAYWVLWNRSDTFFNSDAGSIADSDRKSRRMGVEWNNDYSFLPWLDLDADLALSKARFTDSDPTGAGSYVPDSVTSVVQAGFTAHNVPHLGGAFGSIRLRYFGPRPLIEDNSQRSAQSMVLNLETGYNFGRTWAFRLEVLNLANRSYNDNEYYYASRLRTEPAGPDDGGGFNGHQVHPGEPRSLRASLVAKF